MSKTENRKQDFSFVSSVPFSYICPTITNSNKKMKKGILSAFITTSVMLAGCNNGNTYTISGKVDKSSDGENVYLLNYTENGLDTIATATVSGQKFELKGDATQPQAYILVYENDENEYYSEIFTEPGKIKVTLGEESSARGTKSNDALDDLKIKFSKLNEEVSEIYQNMANCSDTTLMKELQNQMKEKTTEYDGFIKSFINENINNLAGLYMLNQIVMQIDAKELEGYISKMTEDTKNHPMAKSINELYKKNAETQPGKPIKDFTMNDINGNPQVFSQLITQKELTLVDFWASWCGPCMREIPNMIQLSKDFAENDFQIIGISFDNDKEAWEKAVKEKGLDWIQLSDLAYWNNIAGELYNVKGIPHLMLVNKEGKIVSKGLSFEETKATIEEYFK